ncbi:MAG TPA: ABC transporter permease [Terriglobia bacterium]|nr:ABC transporter permease [Terriglobia bacterium]
MIGGLVRKGLFYILVIIIWEVASELSLWPSFLLPSPAEVLQTLVEGFSDKTFVFGIVASLRRILIGYFISVFAGVLLGLAIGRNRFLKETVGSLILGLQTLPSVCWLPLALLWFGLNDSAIIFVVIMGALLSITIATETGIRNVPPLLLRAGRNMGASGAQLLLEVAIPAALPSIISGMKQGWSFAWRSLMAGELLYGSVGLGNLLMVGRELNEMSQVLAVMLIIVLIGLCIDHLVFAILEGEMRRRWGLETG